jgi:hypothetical protein
MVVKEEADARRRIAVANVRIHPKRSHPESGVYSNIWFHYNDILLEVT